jgi:hypothetical protein
VVAVDEAKETLAAIVKGWPMTRLGADPARPELEPLRALCPLPLRELLSLLDGDLRSVARTVVDALQRGELVAESS